MLDDVNTAWREICCGTTFGSLLVLRVHALPTFLAETNYKRTYLYFIMDTVEYYLGETPEKWIS